MDSPTRIFKALHAAIAPLLAASGFTLIEEGHHPQCFGSHYVTFAAGPRQLRLVYDGKEGWFVLEHRSDGADGGWSDLEVVPFDTRTGRPTGAAVLARILEALKAHLRR